MHSSSSSTTLETRSDWERALGNLLGPIRAHASPGCARVRLPGGRPSSFGEESDSLEAFARSLWGAGAWLATDPAGALTVGDRTFDVGRFFRTGLVNGTDADHPESWHPLLTTPQTLVEAAAIAWNLVLARVHLWDPLGPGERSRVLHWLAEAARIPPYDCNWHLFTVVVLTALKLLGGSFDQSRIAAELDRVEDFYLGDGWYDDNQAEESGLTLDYYNATVFHPYLLFWAHFDGRSQPERAARVREHARVFLEGFPAWFAADGSFPCFGRSATYRCALLHGLLWGVIAGASPLRPGQVRRLCRLTVSRFLDAPGSHGPDGQLTLGFTREFPALAEHYSGSGSPYWAAKAFSILALPRDHDLWSAAEEPLPVESGDFTRPAAGGAFLLHGSTRDGQVQLVNGGSLVFAKKYSNLTYSTHFGYEIDRHRELDEADPFGEASLTFSAAGETWHGRQHARALGSEDGILLTESTYWLRRLAGRVRVITAVAFVGDAQLRVHRVETRRRVYAREGGFSCGWDAGAAGPLLLGGQLSLAAAGDRTSAIAPVRGYDEAPKPAPGGYNVLHPRSAVPQVRTRRRRRGRFYLASLSLARPAPFERTDLPAVGQEHVDMLIGRIDTAAKQLQRSR